MIALERIRDINANRQDDIFKIRGVTGMGVGFLSDTAGAQTDEIGIIVYIDTALTSAIAIPTRLDGVTVQVQRGRFKHPFASAFVQDESRSPADAGDTAAHEQSLTDNPREKLFNPMVGGISGNPDFFYVSPKAGTIGLVVRDAADRAMILSNRHVICGKQPKVGDGVSQPARFILGDLAASLVKWQLGDVAYQGKQYGVDAAVASPVAKRGATIGEVYGLRAVTGSGDPTLGLAVTKSGLTTGVTVGTINRIDVRTTNEDGTVLSNQVTMIAPSGNFSEGGDSGSVIIDTAANTVVALLWGANDTTRETVASPIAPILDLFNCKVI